MVDKRCVWGVDNKEISKLIYLSFFLSFPLVLYGRYYISLFVPFPFVYSLTNPTQQSFLGHVLGPIHVV